MKCQYCGNDVPFGSQNCPSCGAAAPQQQMPPNGYVQTPQQPPPNMPPNYPQKNRATFIILGIFLGSIGVHNFYTGYNGKGICQLLITVFIGWLFFPWLAMEIWSLIEICTVTKDANGIEMK